MKPRTRIILFTVFLAVHLAAAASVVFHQRPVIWPLHNDTVHRLGRGADFYAVYHAGVCLRKGLNPYTDVPDGRTPYWYFFRYLPAVAMAAIPLTYFPPETAYRLWAAALEMVLFAFLFVIRKRIAGPGVRLAATGLLLLASPYFLELYLGQFTFVAVTLCCLSYLLPAGVVIYCVSVLLKPLTLAALPALLRERRYRMYVLGALLCLLAVCLPYFVGRPEEWRAFFSANFKVKGGFHAGNYGLLRLLQLMVVDFKLTLTPARWHQWTDAFRILLLAATAGLVFRSGKRAPGAGTAALLLAHFLTYQHVWEHHMSAVTVLGIMLLTSAGQRRWFTATVLVSVLMLALPTPFIFFDTAKDPSVWDPARHWPKYASYAVLLPKVIPTLLLYICSLVKLCTRE